MEIISKSYLLLYEGNKVMAKIKECVKLKNTSYTHTHKVIEDEKVKYIKIIFQPVYDKEGQVKEINVIGVDITEEEMANKKMIKALKAQEEIFVNTSHELKTPINLIFSASQLLNMHLNNENTKCKIYQIEKNNQIITQNCYRIIKLINNIMDISKIEEGFCELNLENRDIVSVIDDIVQSVSDYIKDMELNIIFDPEVEEKIIAFDLYKFERIMLNLISNAIKYSNDNGVIFISLIDKEDCVEISVKDDGIGIDESSIDSIFNKFKQENKSLNRRVEGTGIGLSLVKSLVELHGGKVGLESAINVGSTFTIELPSIAAYTPINVQEEHDDENRVEMIKFELSDIYS